MPLQKKSLDSVLGLNTERNDTSGINSPDWSSMSAWAIENASSGATAPNTLLDCSNIIISRNKQAAARTAFAEVWDFSTAGSENSFQTVGLYAIPNSTSNSIQFAWVNSTSANIANFQSALQNEMNSSTYIIGGVYSTDFTGYKNLTPDFEWNTSGFPLKSFNLSRYNTSFRNIYIFSSNGIFRTTAPYLQDITSSNYNKFKRVTLPLVRSLSATLNPTPDEASRWFQSGYQVDIRVVLTDQLTATQLYQGKPSRTLTITNTSTVTSLLVSFSVDNTNIFVNTTGTGAPGSGGVAIYRTTSYLPSVGTTSDFYKCWEGSLDSGTTVSNVTSFSNIELKLNDDSIKQLQTIYTSLNAEAAQLPNRGTISPESSAPPTARDVINIQNFTVYGNVMCPPFATLTMTALPNTDGNDKVQVGSTNVSITYTPNSTVAPANDGVINDTTGTFKGVSNTPDPLNPTVKGYNLVIRPQNPTTDSSGGANAAYSVPWYAIADKLVITGGSGSTYDIQITPKTGELFDITHFQPTGIVAVVQTKTSGYVVALFSYQSYEQTSASNFYLFKDCISYGIDFTHKTWADPTGLQTSGEYVLYYIAGTTVTALPVYALGSNATGYSSQVGFSLQATFDRFPDRPFNQQRVGVTTSYSNNGPTTAFTPILAALNFGGVYAKDAGKLLDSCVRTLCDTYNLARAAEDPYAVYVDSPTAPVGQIRFESIYSGYNRFSSYTTNPNYTSGTGFYDQVTACVFRSSGSLSDIQVKFAEPVRYVIGTPVLVNIMQQSVQTVAGITVSKSNKPEEIPIGQNLQPLIVGDPLKPIIKLINQLNQMLIFKENEGTYRAYLSGAGAGIIPTVTGLSLLDNTAWLLLPESVQVFEGTVIYFSNKGFVSISPMGQVSEISPTIATEVLQDYADIYQNQRTDEVRSWVITQQRLYCCYFPNVNQDYTSVTYVFSFSTGQWTKWSGEINDAVVSASGFLTLVENIYKMNEAITSTDVLDVAEINLNSKWWSVIRQANFQVPSLTQIEDTISLNPFTVVSQDGDSIKISNFNTTNVYGNLYNILMLWKNRTIWYFSQTYGFISATILDTKTNLSVTLKLEGFSNENPFVHQTNDYLITTVNIALYFNKFFIAQPRGSTMCHFNEVQLYTQQGEEYSFLNIAFNSLVPGSDYVVLRDEVTNVVTNSGSFVTLNSTIEDLFTQYYPLSTSVYTFRVLVPRGSARGRFLQIALKHDTPNEVFKLNSIVYIYRDLNSTKIKAHAS